MSAHSSFRFRAQLPHRPVGGVAFGHVRGTRVDDKPLRQRARQHQLALDQGDERVAQGVEPELRAADPGDVGIVRARLHDMAGLAGDRREHPVPQVRMHGRAFRPAARKDLRQLPRDRELQRNPRLRLLDPEQAGLEINPLPAQGEDLAPPHSGVEAEQEHVPVHRVPHHGVDSRTPLRQDLRRGRDPLPPLRVVAPAAREPELDRVSQALVTHARTTVDRPQEGQALVGGHRARLRLSQSHSARTDVPTCSCCLSRESMSVVAIQAQSTQPASTLRPVLSVRMPPFPDFLRHPAAPGQGRGAPVRILQPVERRAAAAELPDRATHLQFKKQYVRQTETPGIAVKPAVMERDIKRLSEHGHNGVRPELTERRQGMRPLFDHDRPDRGCSRPAAPCL